MARGMSKPNDDADDLETARRQRETALRMLLELRREHWRVRRALERVSAAHAELVTGLLSARTASE